MDKFRDKTRDNLYGNLINLGIDCKLAKRKIVEEKLFNSWYQRSLGIIEINENTPIKYINILKKELLDIFFRDINEMMVYKESQGFINERLKVTENPRLISP